MRTTRYYVSAALNKIDADHRQTVIFETSYFVDLNDRAGHRAQIDKLLGSINITTESEYALHASDARMQLDKWIKEANLLGPLMNHVAYLSTCTFTLKVYSEYYPLPELRKVEA